MNALPISSKDGDTSKAPHPNNVTIPKKDRGYATEPYRWEELRDIILNKKDLALLSRSVEQERVYEAFKLELKQTWKSIYDYILHTKFDFEKRPVSTLTVQSHSSSLAPVSSGQADVVADEVPIVYEAYPTSSEVKEIRKSLGLNDFPYYFPDNIEHWVLWKLGGEVTDDDLEEAKEKLGKMGDRGELLDTLNWLNPPHLMSLPGIDHVHILCLRNT